MATPDLKVGPAAPVPATSSRALVRVLPVAPQAVPDLPAAPSPLGRSGLDLRELLGTTDTVAVRAPTPAVALEMGLEQARGSLVRNQPAHALATLDEVWHGAKHTETGWYLRGSSLALLGLPAEASRVAADGVSRNPNSAANHFLQSLAKLTLGDLNAAQTSLANATANHEPSALLFAQKALLEAERGNMSDAERLLKHAAARWPNHAAVTYGREMIRQVLNDHGRSNQVFQGEEVLVHEQPAAGRSPATVPAADTTDGPGEAPTSPRLLPGAAPSLNGTGATGKADRNTARDIASDALHQLAAKLVTGSKPEALANARALLVSLSAGGTVATAVSAARAHAMRALTGAVIDALQGGADAPGIGWIAESVDGGWRRADTGDDREVHDGERPSLRESDTLLNAARTTVAALQDGRFAEAEAQIRRLSGSVSDTTLGMLHGLVAAARESAADAASAADSGKPAFALANGQPGFPVHSAEVTNALLAPLRLGLALLPEPLHATDFLTRTDTELGIAAGYGAAMSGALPTDFTQRARQVHGGFGALGAAVVVMALSVLAFAASERLLGVAFAGAAGWLVLRGVSNQHRDARH